ncbi:MAG TPA: Holliday junction resolvase RuvX [Thermoanaerobaculia bacterium]|jgi:putative Holliday junction resolvase|nr:Holliday junction resolvase RuvX [Thermoanaerobaculia bacterium]
MAVDLGAKRIGVAVSESGILATPHSVLRNEGDVIGELAALAERLDARTIVVGVPRRAYADPREVRFHEFAERLRQKTCREVVLWDEALTTVEAAERLRDAGRSRRDAQRDIDMAAAAVILQSYLDEKYRRQS